LLAIFLLVHFYLLSRPLRLWFKVLLTASLGASLLALFFTFTRGPWLAGAAGIGTLALLRRRYRRAVIGLGLAGLIFASIGVIGSSETEFLEERVENTETIENRLSFIVNCFQIFRDYPVFGVGFFNYKQVRGLYNQGFNLPFYGYVKKKLGAEAVIHDIYVGRLAEEGLISLILIGALYLSLGRIWLNRWRHGPFDSWFNRDFLAMLAGMMVCYLVGGMVIDYRYFDLVNVIFLLCAGIVIGYRANPEVPATESNPPYLRAAP
jgi:O-antigen ligase